MFIILYIKLHITAPDSSVSGGTRVVQRLLRTNSWALTLRRLSGTNPASCRLSGTNPAQILIYRGQILLRPSGTDPALTI